MAIAGRVAIVPKGEWSQSVTYDKLDLVTHNGNTFIAYKSSVGVTPVDGDTWMLILEGVDPQDIDNIIDGTTPVGNALQLGGKGASEYAKTADLANYLPINGTGTMTGAVNLGNGLGYVHSYSNKTELEVKNSADDTVNKRRLTLWNKSQESNINNALMLYERKEDDSGWNRVTFLHTGNKPNGTYTGNGSATERTISTGGIGSVCMLRSGSSYMGFVTQVGGVMFGYETKTTKYFGPTEIKFYEGVLTILSADNWVNSSGSKYTYQVL